MRTFTGANLNSCTWCHKPYSEHGELTECKETLTAQYLQAIETHNQAIRVFKVALAAYRMRTITDLEFCAAKATYDKATAAFDVAFAREANRCALCSETATQTVAGTGYCATHGKQFRDYLASQVTG